MANEALKAAATTEYFLKENESTDGSNIGTAYAYMGDLGLSLSNVFAVTRKGQAFLKEGKIGGVLPDYETVDSKINTKLTDWREGWTIKRNRIFSEYYEEKDGEKDLSTVRYSGIYNDYDIDINIKGEDGKWTPSTKETSHYLCFGSPSTSDFTRAAFRVTKSGNLYISDATDEDTDSDYSQGYGNVGLRVTTWRYDADNNEDGSDDNDTSKDKKKKYQTVINPNSIYFFNRQKWNDDKDKDKHTARITYVPGRYGSPTSDIPNGHFIKFSCPIKTGSIYLSDDSIRYITTGIGGSEAHFSGERYFYIGPSRADTYKINQYNTNETKDSAKAARGYTILRGRALNLQAYGRGGADDTKYLGHILFRAHNLLLQNDARIRAFKHNALDVDEIADNSVCMLRLGAGKIKDKNGNELVNEKNRIILGTAAENTLPLEIRSRKGIYLKTNGKIRDNGSQYILYIGPKEISLGNNETGTRMVVRPQYDDTNKYTKGVYKGKIIPYARLGSASYRWHSVYTFNLVQASDKRLKKEIKSLDTQSKYLKLFDSLRPVSYKYNELYAPEENSNQINFGFIAQEIKQSLEEIGLQEQDFSGLIHETEDNLDYYSLDYTKFVALNTAKIKQLESVILEQSAQIEKQQKQIELLLSKLD